MDLLSQTGFSTGSLEQMMARRLGQIWQFGFGSGWTVIGILGLVAFTALHYLQPPPSVDELRPVSGVLTDRIHVHRPSKGGPWASFTVRTTDGVVNARINDYGFLWGCEEKPELLTLRPGDEITTWFTTKDLSTHAQAAAWQIQRDGAPLLSFEQSLAAHHERERRFLLFAVGILCIGSVLSVWGLHIYAVEQKKVSNVL